MLLTRFLFEVPDHHLVVPRVTLVPSIVNVQRQPWLQIVDADGNPNYPTFAVCLLLHRDDWFVPSRVERLHVVVLLFDL